MKNSIIQKKNTPFIIAEIGNNHEGSFETAKKLIKEAAKTGVDAVKFQTFKTEEYISSKDKKRFARLKKFELNFDEFIKLAKIAKKHNLHFISTPFDLESAEKLNDIVDCFKISSGDNNYFALIEKILSYKKDIIISTGLLDSRGIRELINFFKKKNFSLKKVHFLHCVSDYPVNNTEANLLSIRYLKEKFSINVGYSDHTLGVESSIIATSYGASIIEKHFTIDKNFSNFRDHQISADTSEMKKIVELVKKTRILIGTYGKFISTGEKKNIKLMRRSIYFRNKIKENTIISTKHIKIVRPMSRLLPIDILKVIGKRVKRSHNKDQAVNLKNLKK